MTDQHHDMHDFSAADMEKYWQGLLPPAAMYALEKAALDDPFLADALEGYRHLASTADNSSAGDLTLLKDRMTKRISNSQKKRFNWWRPAAAAILILGTSLIGYLLVQRSTPASQDQVSAPVQQPDSVSSLVKIIPPAKDSALVLPNDVAIATPKVLPVLPAAAPAPATASGAIEESTEKADSSRQTPPTAVAAAENRIPEQVSENAAAKAATPDTGLVARSDSKKEEALNEVVASGYSAKKKPAAARKETQVKNLSVEVQNAVPVKGWNDYNQYLKEQAQIPDSLQGLHGQVVLMLTVKSNGKISDIAVEQSLHPVLDEEAQRLVKEGPSWKILKGRKASVYVIVPF